MKNSKPISKISILLILFRGYIFGQCISCIGSGEYDLAVSDIKSVRTEVMHGQFRLSINGSGWNCPILMGDVQGWLGSEPLFIESLGAATPMPDPVRNLSLHACSPPTFSTYSLPPGPSILVLKDSSGSFFMSVDGLQGPKAVRVGDGPVKPGDIINISWWPPAYPLYKEGFLGVTGDYQGSCNSCGYDFERWTPTSVSATGLTVTVPENCQREPCQGKKVLQVMDTNWEKGIFCFSGIDCEMEFYSTDPSYIPIEVSSPDKLKMDLDKP